MKTNKLMRHAKVALWLLFSLLLLTPALHAQDGANRVISGTVKDEDGNALPGVTVEVKETKQVETTDNLGFFSISVDNRAKTLVFTFVGLDSKEVSIGSANLMDIVLNQRIQKMDEVVVIGYGTAKRANVSSSISSVNAKDIKDLPVAGVDQALQGKVAGVAITNNSGQPGGGVSIKVRGVTSINSNDPLIVIDGVPFMSNTRNTSGYAGLGGSDGQTGNSVLASINPNDIESVDVLKDASAQSIYGSLAANGVILITTKKGKVGEGKINYDVYYGQSDVVRKLDVMDLKEFAQYQNEVADILGIQKTEEFADPSILGKGTDWQEAMFRKGQVANHQLSFSGGKEKTNYYLSLNYFDQSGILIGSDFKRFSTRFSLDHQLKRWMKIGVATNANRSIQNVTLADAAEGTIWWGAIQNPLIPVRNLDGTWGGGNIIGGVQYSQDNPIARSNLRGNKGVNSQVFGNIYADIQLIKSLSFRNELAYSLGLNNNSAYQLAGNIGPTVLQSQLFDTRSNSYYYAVRNYLNFDKNFGKHNLSATVGREAQYSYYETLGGKRVNLQNNILDINAGSSDKDTWELNGGKGQWAMESYFARANYTFDSRYAISASFRGDGSSNFGTNNKWGYFPGVSAAWTVSNENFAAFMAPTINYLKLRVGYGSVGNQNLPSGSPSPPYSSNISFWPGPVGFGNASYLNGIPNPDLGWESVITRNLGVDAGLLNGRIDVTVDVYKKTTTDMLMFLTGPRLIGVGDQWDDLKAPIGNVGQMTNTGIDVAINTVNIANNHFTWKTNLIYSQFKNRLDKMATSTAGLAGRIYYDNYTITYTNPGFAVGSFYGLVTDGLFRTQEDLDKSLPQFDYPVGEQTTWLGDIRYKDINGDAKIDEQDITYIGSPLPKFTFGFTNTFQYKNFDLSIFLQGSYGAKVFNFLRWQLEKMDNAYHNQLRSVQDRYSATNTNGSLPRFVSGQVNNIAMSDRYVEDGSYLRIQNLTMGYRVPASILNRAGINNIRAYISVQNLWTFTNYSGYDPEVGAFNNSIRLMNVDAGHYPNPRTVTVGLNLEL